MPISLAPGTVKTPAFPVKHKYYNISIQSEWLLPPDKLKCMMGFAVVPRDNHCPAGEPSLLETKWKVLDGNQIVAEGIDKGSTNSFYADQHYLARYIGTFQGKARHRYVVEVTFLKDGIPLNVTKPRLIVEPPGFSF